VRCSFPNLWRILMVPPLIPRRPIAGRHMVLRGTLTERGRCSPRSAAVTTSAGGRCRGDQGTRIEFRIGIIVGDVVARTATFSATPSTTPHDLEGLAEPGEHLHLGDAFRQVRGKVEAAFGDIGENIARPEIFNTTKGRSSPAWPLPAGWKPLGYGSAWTPRAPVGRRLCRATVAQPKVRRGPPEGFRQRSRGAHRHRPVVSLL
jgi:hypothetical protein